jgi:hypothetical protein
MKRRVAAILEFVGQLQTQRNNHSGASSGKNGGGSGGGTPSGAHGQTGAPAELAVAGLVKAVQAAQQDVAKAKADAENIGGSINGHSSTNASSNGNGSGAGSGNEDDPTLTTTTTTASTNSSTNVGAAGPGGALMKPNLVKLNLHDDGDFRCMASQEMMETLTRELVGWQAIYGVYSR